ncbi:MAG: helix-turn-helix domain-containing protein [Chloroflexi bacterium]|nr:helix-turn-helix domain-containing protein [Chloroflexota bacterium]
MSRDEALAWRDAWRDRPTIGEAADILGVSYWVVTDLIACGFLPPPHQLADDGPSWRLNRTAIAATHARAAPQVTLLPARAAAGAHEYLTLGGAARVLHVLGVNAAAILVRVAGGTLPAYHSETTPVRLGDLLFARPDVLEFAALVKAENGWLDRVETARQLGVSKRVLQRLVARGRLAPVPLSSHAHFFERTTVERFRDDHVTSREASALLGGSREVVQRWIRRGRLTAVSGPGLNDAHSYLFKRSVLVQWRAERLPVGEAAALLGVARSTLAHWADAGRVTPLADMGGKQRWFARQDIVRLREDRLQTVSHPRAGVTRGRTR